MNINDNNWSVLEKLVPIEGKYKIPLLEDIIKITKGKIFMNLEIKDANHQIWNEIMFLIEKYEYYDQISICSFFHSYYEKVDKYNKEKNRTIVFGFLKWTSLFLDFKKNHQISLFYDTILGNPVIVENAHDKGMSVATWFYNEKGDMKYYDLFETGVDVIISDYPIRVANQYNDYLKNNYLEGCDSTERKLLDFKLSCASCHISYGLVKIQGQGRNLCKLKYEIDPDLYTKDIFDFYEEKNIISIKMLSSPFDNYAICEKMKTQFFILNGNLNYMVMIFMKENSY
jgi:hypothetical protein